MRAALALVLALGVPAVVHAEGQPLPPTVFENRVINVGGAVPLSPVSHTLYVNQCTGGCTVLKGADDSRTNHSSIPAGTVTLSAFNQGQPVFDQLVQCVKDTFIPFNINVVTVDPGPSTAHFEVMVTGGNSTQLRAGLNAGGVAPFIDCSGTYNNGLSFVFGGTTNDLNFMCGAVAQEAAHVWGLDHEYNKDDPMTYLNLGSLKRFQNVAAQCHDSNQPPNPIPECYCGNATQNSYQYLLSMFGASNLPPATLAISTPTEGQWVKPGFPVRVQLTSMISGVAGGSLSIDGTQTSTIGASQPLAFNAPAMMTGGDHAVLVSASDGGGRSASATVHVKVTAVCSPTAPCSATTNCIGGFCVPGSDVDGGLGAACTSNDTCITSQCGSADGQQLCTGACNSDGTCPSGYSCLGGSGADGVCWPSSDDAQTCSASGGGGGGPFLLLTAFGFVAVVLRRRR